MSRSTSTSSTSLRSSSNIWRIVAGVSAGVAAAVVAWKIWKSRTSDSRTALYSMPAYTQLTLDQAQEIFNTFRPFTLQPAASHSSQQQRFKVTKIKELLGGLSNSNYMFEVLDSISGKSTKMLLKICEEKNFQEVAYQVRSLSMIREISSSEKPMHPDFTSPAPIAYPYRVGVKQEDPLSLEDSLRLGGGGGKGRENTDSYIFSVPSVTERPLVFYQFLDGRMIRSPTPKIMREVARGQAQLHSLGVKGKGYSFEFLPSTPFGMFAVKAQYESQVLNNPSVTSSTDWAKHPFIIFLQNGSLDSIQSCASASDLPQAVIHSDLFLENMMFTHAPSEKLLGIIDFEEMGRGPRLLDVAMTVVGCCYDEKNQLNMELMKSFLDSYQSYFPFTRQEKSLFRAHLIWALIAIAYWRWQNFNVTHPEPNERKEAYLPMQRRVEELDTPVMRKQFDSLFSSSASSST